MKTKDLYQTINAMVRKHTGIEMPSLIFSNKEECVDARYILVYFLAQFLTDDEISRHTNLKRQSINHIRNNFECKLQKWSVKNCTIVYLSANILFAAGYFFDFIDFIHSHF